MLRNIARAFVLIVGVMVVLLGIPRVEALPSPSQPVVFTGMGTFTYPSVTPANRPFGFWLWCEGESSNPYEGQCKGSMYFYGMRSAKAVAGMVVEIAPNTYQITVASLLDTSIDCTLTNVPPITPGFTNTVTVSCTAPAGTGVSTMTLVGTSPFVRNTP